MPCSARFLVTLTERARSHVLFHRQVFYGLALLLASFGIDMGLSQFLLQYVYSLPNSRKNETEGESSPLDRVCSYRTRC